LFDQYLASFKQKHVQICIRFAFATFSRCASFPSEQSLSQLKVKPRRDRQASPLLKYLLRTVGFVLLGSSLASASAQIVTPTDTIAPPVPGVGHDYINILNETVSPENGGVSLRIQVPVPPGRKLTLPFSFNYDSTQTLFFQGDWHMGFGLLTSSNEEPFASGAWSYGLPRLNNFTQTITIPGPTGGSSPDGSTTCGVTSNYTFVDINGSSHQLGLSHIFNNFPGYFGNQSWACGNSHFAEYDSSILDPMYQASFTAGTLTPDSQHNGSEQPNDGQPKVAGPDGTLYTFPELSCGNSANPYPCSRLPASIEDKDGNILTIPNTGQGSNHPGFSVVDTAGRTVLSGNNFGLTGSTVAVSGLAQPYTLTWTTQNYTGYSVNSQSNAPQGTLFCAPSGPIGTGAWTQTVVTAIALPNGQSYKFSYDPTYGVISKITYPSGGYIRYDYALNPLSASITFNGRPAGFGGEMTIAGDACNVFLDTVAVAHRYVSYDGVNEVMQQDYSYSTNWAGSVNSWSTKQAAVKTHDLYRGTAYTTTYNYTSVPITSPPNGSGINAQAPVEQSIVYNDTSGALLQTVTKGWNDQYTLACEVDTLGPSGPSSAVFNTYGPGDVVTDKKEYDYGLVAPSSCSNGATAPSGVGASRETVTKYQPFGNTTYSSPNLLNAPCSVTISGGGVISETDYFYDNGTSVCGVGGTPSVTSVSNLPTGTHDETLFGPSGATARGDVTRIDRKNTGGAGSTTTMSYDETGQVVTATDPCGNTTCSNVTGTGHTTTFVYADSPVGGNSAGNSNAYLTNVTRPNTGVAHSESYKYNYATGKLSEVDDENGQATTYSYNDPLLRLTDIYGPPSQQNGGASPHTNYTYVDGSSPSMTATNPIGVTSKTLYDGLGHLTHTQLTSDPSGIVYADTVYDGSGHIYSISNPYRSIGDSTYGITSYTYDALGRKLLQCQPDNGNNSPCIAGNSYQQWTYSGNVTSFRDESANTWQRTSDAFGRLINVSEPNGASTAYTYNVLNNLLTVNQPGVSGETARSRNFSYDSLSRLVQAYNPESGWICYGTTPPGTTPNGSNCTAGYDGNGNLQYKTTNRGITTKYSYDVLNRLVSKTYTNDPTWTASSCYQYDQSSLASAGANLIGRLTNAWTQVGVCPVPPASPVLQSATILTRRSVLAYDAMGRVLNEQQCTRSNCSSGSYTPSYTYDLAGNISTHTNGIGTMTFTNCYDSAGHLQSVAGVSATCPNTASPTSTLFSVPTYSPAGQLTGATLGLGLKLSRTYDARFRINGETDSGATITAPTPASASVAITGSEQSH
jgi:YD repeat-containing protein